MYETARPVPISSNSSVRENAATKFRRVVVVCEIVADWITIVLSIKLGYLFYWNFTIGRHIHYSAQILWAAGAAFATVMVLMLDRSGAYRGGSSLLRVRETEQILRVSAQVLLLAFSVSFLASVLFARWLLVVSLSLVPLLLVLQKNLMYLVVHSLHSRGYGNERVLIYGGGCTGRRVFSALRRSPKLGLVPVAVVDDDPSKTGTALFEMAYERRGAAKIVRGPITQALIQEYRADLIVIAIPSLGRERFVRTFEEALSVRARVSFVPNQFISTDSWVDYRDVDGILLASLGKPPIRVSYEVAKRITDVLGSLALMVLGVPVFFLLSILIKLDSNGSVIFQQERVGKNGRKFWMYKFRTMYTSANRYGYSPRESDDPRITRVGRLLRKSSLDELPQLFNVLQGHMSLVGPRPEMPFIVEGYSGPHRQRLRVKPGLTGLWQLSGDRAFLIHENIEYDLYYIQHRNFFMDLAILLHTCLFAMRGI